MPPPNPGDFPVGSPESRAAARYRASLNRVHAPIFLDDDGNPIWDEKAVYGSSSHPLRRKLSREEWLEKYGPDAPKLSREEERRRSETCDRNRIAGLEALQKLVAEYGLVPGRVAAARIPKGPSVETRVESSDREATDTSLPRQGRPG